MVANLLIMGQIIYFTFNVHLIFHLCEAEMWNLLNVLKGT